MGNNFYNNVNFRSLLLEDLNKNEMDQKDRKNCIHQIVQSGDMIYFLSDLIDDNKSLEKDEYEYIKNYFLKYRLMDALWLKKHMPNLFSEKDNEYLLCASIENEHIAKKRLYYQYEDDNKDIVNVLIDKHVLSFLDLKTFLNIDNNLLQECLFEKFEHMIEELKPHILSLKFRSKLFKEIFILKLDDEKFVDDFIKDERFLSSYLDLNEKMLFHDLYYEKIWKDYIKSSETKKQKYTTAYGHLLFESEMMDQLNPYYKNGNMAKINRGRELFHFTENMVKKDDAFEVKRKISKMN